MPDSHAALSRDKGKGYGGNGVRPNGYEACLHLRLAVRVRDAGDGLVSLGAGAGNPKTVFSRTSARFT
jgi:hypothetical protein